MLKFKILKYTTICLLFILIILAGITCLYFIHLNKTEVASSLTKQFGIVFSSLASSIGILFASLTYFFNRESNEKGQIEKYFSYFNNDINDIVLGNRKGVDALLAFDLVVTQEKNVVLSNLSLILSSFETYFQQIENNEIISNSYRKFSKTRLNLLFYTKVLWPLHETITKHGKEFIDGKHDDSKVTLPKFAEISIKCIEYLIDEGIAVDSGFKKDNIKLLRNLLTK